MYLKKMKIKKFRKFGENESVFEFVCHEKKSENKVASSSTLIVGKNNTGKTTATKALKKIFDNNSDLKGSDFNYCYLERILEDSLVAKKKDYLLPSLDFEFTIAVEYSASERLTNLIDFIDAESVLAEREELDLTIRLAFEVEEAEEFRDALHKLLSKHGAFNMVEGAVPFNKGNKHYFVEINKGILKFQNQISRRRALIFKKFTELISQTSFSINVYGLNGNLVDSKSFKFANLFSLKIINANSSLHDKSISNIFNKIIKNRYLSEGEFEKLEELNDEIDVVNKKISDRVSNDHHESVNGVLHQIELHGRLGINLSANLDFEKLTRDLIKHEYTEQGFFIPEAQFGLGYTNLMNIIGEIIDYVEKYPSEGIESKVNLICIEEPEAFMHPQMQEGFIKYINNAVGYLLESSGKDINSQLLITTHSAHILNSKIHCSNSFNNINFIRGQENAVDVISFNDEVVSGGAQGSEQVDKAKNDLKFLKKHIKSKVSDMFFADAVIFVEGVTEETLLSHYIDQDEVLNKAYITIIKINGAHGQIYMPLVEQIKIPALFITDLDIKRNEDEKFEVVDAGGKPIKVEVFKQIDSLEERLSTNSTIHKFNGKESTGLREYFEDRNIFGVFQKNPISGYFATSFEEAFILSNFDNDILNEALKGTVPNIYNDIIKECGVQGSLCDHSYKLQKKLKSSKSDFANNLLYEILINEDQDANPMLPAYILDGLDWLKGKLAAVTPPEVL